MSPVLLLVTAYDYLSTSDTWLPLITQYPPYGSVFMKNAFGLLDLANIQTVSSVQVGQSSSWNLLLALAIHYLLLL